MSWRAVSCAVWMSIVSCGGGTEPPNPPPPLPVAPTPATPTDVSEPQAQKDPGATTEAQKTDVAEKDPPPDEASSARRAPKKGASLYDLEPDLSAKAKAGSGPSTPTPTPEPDRAEPAKPAANASKPEPEPPPPAPFVPPSSKSVSLELPSGLKADLAKDTRMKPWLDQGLAAATRCYEEEAKSSPGLSGVIEVAIVMHENDRPDASLKSLPSSLASVFTCVSGAMMGKKMPLFTGQEGQRYVAKVRFSP